MHTRPALLPAALFPAATRLDAWLVRRRPELGSFVDIEVVRTYAV